MSDSVGVAVVGCGYWGKNLVRNFAELGVLEALVDENKPAVLDLTAKYGGRALAFEEALVDPKVQAVAIAAPASMHHALAKRALEAGKHVFVEKPLSLEVADAKELCALAERFKLRLMVGHLLQYHPAFLELINLVRDGRLGRVQYLYSNRLNLGKVRREEDILWSFAPHDISMILSIIGSEPAEVLASGGYYLHDTIADVTTTHLVFPGGERAHVFVSWLHPFKDQKLVVVGSDAMVVFDDGEDWDRKLLFYPHKVEWRDRMPVVKKANAVPIAVSQDEPLKSECQHFIDCVLHERTPRTDGREGVRVLSVLARAAEALRRARAGEEPARARRHHPSRVEPSHPGVTIHESAYVDDNVEIGEGSKIWHFSHVLGEVTLGKNVNIGQNVMIGPRVTIGDNVKIQNNVSLYEGVTLEESVFCGPSCVFTNVKNPRSAIARKSEYLPTLVKRGASIGANATIVCGHTIGEYAFVAAGAVIAADVPAFAIFAGVPAKRVGWMSHAGVRLGPDLICPQTGRRYREVDVNQLEEIADDGFDHVH
ncbi:Gfo/Idh/MocA family oxidoreductase [Microvirga pudoricolor]|uniref:Gfo/Idh/MocA family oxidoreductase n=1 Tax=Microvirga pudoricolor TaxID=2778729 RepID=UPI001951568A|nr:Gfo/Idh/MocA family oxidoreductase [Microvirga pudoricolor]MBM6593007.1 Gfo/Idh/MocA family oxidoreductase [Microvirga pudoricolor]